MLKRGTFIAASALVLGLITVTPTANAAGPTKVDFRCGGITGGDCQVVATVPAVPAGPAAAPAPTQVAESAGGSSGSSGGASAPAAAPTIQYVNGLPYSIAALDRAAATAARTGTATQPIAALMVNPAAPAGAAAPAAPVAPPPPPSPAEVAQIAISQMQLQPVGIGIVPKDEPGKIGVVGMPTWMWVKNPGEATTGPMTRSATAGPVTVTAVATLDRVVWSMGDGTSVTCHGAGVPYSAGWGAQDSPTCGHRYQHTSENQPGMAYTVTATSYWTINWFGGGGAGVVPQQVAASTRIQVGEFQAIVTRSGN
jgi:hypothetical protein